MNDADRFLTEARPFFVRSRALARLVRSRTRLAWPPRSLLDEEAVAQFSLGAAGTCILALLGCL